MTDAAAIALENPFPAQAVTTFGAAPSTRIAPLRALRQATEMLTNCLVNWSETGAAVAISGAHGGGKTFLLERAAAHLQAQTTANPQVVYVKADNTSFVALYRQILGKLNRDRLVDLVTTAIRLRALTVTGAAKSTLAAREVIEKTQTLDAAYKTTVLDANVLKNWLRTELEGASQVESVAQRVAAAIGLLDDPQVGQAAYQWLEGAENPPPLPNSALATPLLGPTGAEPVDAVIGALECLARLHALAERPLVLMVDQMEALLGANTNVDNSSFVKKFAEQLKARQAILLLAGTPAGWRRLAVDVGPRLWMDEPLRVGVLELDEISALIDAFAPPTTYSSEGLPFLREVTGGNPRAIIQTSNRVFHFTKGRLDAADHDLIARAFAASGLLRDRARVAYEVLVQTAREQGFDVRPAPGALVSADDVLLTAPSGRMVLATVLKLPDRVKEAAEAARLTTLRGELALREPFAGMLVVGVGYTSETIRNLLGNIAEAVIAFDDATYMTELQPVLARLAEPMAPSGASAAPPPGPLPAEWAAPLAYAPEPAAPQPPQPQPPPQPDPALTAQIDRLQDLIGEVERLRRAADSAASDRFASTITAIAEPELNKARAQNLNEMRGNLDRLWETLRDGDPSGERDMIRSLLIANEANLQDDAFELLGGLYLQVSDLARYAPDSGLFDLRSRLLVAMREILDGTAHHWLEHEPVRSLAGIILGIVVAAVTGAFIFATRDKLMFELIVPVSLAFGFVAGASLVIWLEFRRRPQLRYRSLMRRVARARRAAPPPMMA